MKNSAHLVLAGLLAAAPFLTACCATSSGADPQAASPAPSSSAGSPQARPGMLPESWRQHSEIPPAFYYADDVEARVREPLEQAFAAAIDAWGNFGPLEYWVVGKDVGAAEALAERYCEVRQARGDQLYSDCQRHARQREEFVEWASMAAEIESSGRAFLNAGRNGRADWGVHLFSSSLPPGWAGLGDIQVEDDQTVLFHEYFHAVQHAYVMPLDHDERDRLMGPVWWVEGGAEFMAQATSERMRASGAIPYEQRELGRPWRVEERMRIKMEQGLALLAEHPDLSLAEVEYGPQADIAYHLGAWAIAYLCDQGGPDVLLECFYPNLSELGWEGAFQACFGRTSEEFYAEFDAFLQLPLTEQLSILP